MLTKLRAFNRQMDKPLGSHWSGFACSEAFSPFEGGIEGSLEGSFTSSNGKFDRLLGAKTDTYLRLVTAMFLILN